MRAMALAVALLLAGCAGDPGPATPAGALPPGPMEFDGCEHLLLFVPADGDAARAALPEGFTPETLGPIDARQLIMGTRCDGIGGSVQDIGFSEVLLGIVVSPPEELARDDAPFHLALLALTTTSEAAAERYQAWNVSIAEAGEVAFEYAAGSGTLRSTLGGRPLDASVAAESHTAAEAGGLRAFIIRDATVIAAIDYAWPDYEIASGAGLVRAGAGFVGGPDASAGEGYHERGDGYGLTLTPWPLPPGSL